MDGLLPNCTAWHLTPRIAYRNGETTARDPGRVTSVQGDSEGRQECPAPSNAVCQPTLRSLTNPNRAMNIFSCSLRHELSVDFSRACAQLTEARIHQVGK